MGVGDELGRGSGESLLGAWGVDWGRLQFQAGKSNDLKNI